MNNSLSEKSGKESCDANNRQRHVEDDEIGDGLKTSIITESESCRNIHGPERMTPNGFSGGERRRRKLPEIPKNKKCKLRVMPTNLLHVHIPTIYNIHLSWVRNTM